MSDLPFWLPLLTALIATGSALGGVYLKGRLDRAEKAADRRWEKARRDYDFRRDKAEELYTHIDRYCTLHDNIYTSVDAWLSGKVSGPQLMDMIAQDQERISHDSTRVNFIIQTYYPEIKTNFSYLRDKFSEINDIMSGFSVDRSTLRTQRPSADNIHAFHCAIEGARSLHNTISEQLTKLAKPA